MNPPSRQASYLSLSSLPLRMRRFLIDTPLVHLEWHGPDSALRPGEDAPADLQGLRVEGGRGIRVDPGHPGAGLLHEETTYTVLVRSKTPAPIGLSHADPVLTRGLKTSEQGRIVHGPVRFGSQVGESRFSVEVGGLAHLSFQVEVLPSKLDYRTDYRALREDLDQMLTGLAHDYLRATVQGHDLGGGPAGRAGWVALLSAYFDRLEGAIEHLSATPITELTAHRDLVPLRRLRRGRAHLAPQLTRTRTGAPLAGRLVGASVVAPTTDTAEHRWLRVRLGALRRQLADVASQEAARSGPRAPHIAQGLQRLAARADLLVRKLPAASDVAGSIPPTVRLLSAPGYREAAASLLHLERGLVWRGEAVDLSVRDLHYLYEVWCYLTVVRLAARLGGNEVPVEALVGVEEDGLRLRLRRGRKHRVRLPRPGGGYVDLVYNPYFGGDRHLVPQRPDIWLAVATPGGTRHAILDAKYRVDPSPGYVGHYGAPGPPKEALNTLHRYRDALRRRLGGTPDAVALFPGRLPPGSPLSPEQRSRGVGALGLLPGEEAQVEAWLRGLLGLPDPES